MNPIIGQDVTEKLFQRPQWRAGPEAYSGALPGNATISFGPAGKPGTQIGG